MKMNSGSILPGAPFPLITLNEFEDANWIGRLPVVVGHPFEGIVLLIPVTYKS